MLGASNELPEVSVVVASESRPRTLASSVNSCFGASLFSLAAIYSVMLKQKIPCFNVLSLTGKTL
jgi:hypothetical protein